jgi:hypothetical protein
MRYMQYILKCWQYLIPVALMQASIFLSYILISEFKEHSVDLLQSKIQSKIQSIIITIAVGLDQLAALV